MREDCAVAFAAPDFLGRSDSAPVAGGVIAFGESPVHHSDRAARLFHGGKDVSIRVVSALEHLIARGIHEIVFPFARPRLCAHRIRPRGDRLRLQRLDREGIAHFIADHAAEIIFDPNIQNT